MSELKSHQLSMTVLMSPEMANFSGKVHGGAILRLLDQVAYACASRYAGHYVVTLSVDQVMFRQPIAVGELVTFLASVNYTGTSSMEVGIKVVAEDILNRSVRHANSCSSPWSRWMTKASRPRCRRCSRRDRTRNAATRPRRSAGSCARKWNSATWNCCRQLRAESSEPAQPVFCTPCETPLTQATSARSSSSSSRPLSRQRLSRSTCSTLIGST
jgi:Acyl-CoA hydrolase